MGNHRVTSRHFDKEASGFLLAALHSDADWPESRKQIR